MISQGLPMNIKGSKKRAKVTERNRKADPLDIVDAKLCDEVLPKLVNSLEDPDTKWLSYDKNLDDKLAQWSTQTQPHQRVPHSK